MAKITINGAVVKVKNGSTILNAAKSIGVDIPTLCFIKEINEIGFCRICVVEVDGEQDLVSACNTEIKNGMVIHTDSDKVTESRNASLQLLASKHRFDCWRCPKDGMCEFYDLLKKHDVVFEEFGPGIGRNPEKILGTGISQDQSKCVLCKRCVAVCNSVTTTKVLKFRDDDGINPIVSPTPGLAFDDAGCIFCGQCVKACPTGTLHETDGIKKVEALLRDKNKVVTVQFAQEVKTAIAEEFGYEIGTQVADIEPKFFEALKLLGFKDATDTNWAADITMMEEATELVDRIKNGGILPLMSSSCAAWVRYAELYQPTYLENLSTSKSPHMMQGALIKNYYAPTQLKENAADVAVVSIMPCTAKKYEIDRAEMETDGVRDVDAVLTVRELVKMIKRRGIDFRRLEGITLDNPLADFTKAGKTYIEANGSMESTLRTVASLLEDDAFVLPTFKTTHGMDFKETTGLIKEATVTIAGNKLNVAIVQGGAAIKELFIRMKKGKKQYHYIQLSVCPGGCVNGGGMPIVKDMPIQDVIQRRSESLLSLINEETPIRNAHENDENKKVYQEFLGDVNSEVAQKYLHTHYSQKDFRKE